MTPNCGGEVEKICFSYVMNVHTEYTLLLSAILL